MSHKGEKANGSHYGVMFDHYLKREAKEAKSKKKLKGLRKRG